MKKLYCLLSLLLIICCTACNGNEMKKVHEFYKDLEEEVTINGLTLEIDDYSIEDKYSNTISLTIKVTNTNVEARSINLTDCYVLRHSNGAKFDLSNQSNSKVENDLSCTFSFTKNIPTSANEENYSILFMFEETEIAYNFFAKTYDIGIIRVNYNVDGIGVYSLTTNSLQSIVNFVYVSDVRYIRVTEWYLEESLTTKVKSSTYISEDCTLYGKSERMFTTVGNGEITLTGLNYAPSGDTLTIPSIVYLSTVTKLEDGFLSASDEVVEITIPTGIYFSSNSLNYCTSLYKIFYLGTEEEWNTYFSGNLNNSIEVYYNTSSTN